LGSSTDFTACAAVGHVARHRVLPEEAEQAVLNDPVDLLGMRIEGLKQQFPELFIDYKRKK